MGEWYERSLGGVEDLKWELKYRTKEMKSIKIKDRETSSDMERKRLDLLGMPFHLDTK